MQAAAGGTGLLQEHGVVADPDMGLGGKHALHQLCEQGVRQRLFSVEVAAGGATHEQVIEVAADGAWQGEALLAVAAIQGFHRRRAQDFTQFTGGFSAGVLHGLHGVGVVPAGEGVQGRGQRMPMHAAQGFVAFAQGGVAFAVADDQAGFQQALERGGSAIG